MSKVDDESKPSDDETLEESRTIERLASLEAEKAKQAPADDAKAVAEASAAVAAGAGGGEPPAGGSKAKAKAKAKGEDKSKGNKLLGNLVFVLGFFATLVAGYYVGQWVRVKFGDKPQLEDDQRYRVALRGDEPQRGPDDALVTIIEFADFQCPYCADSAEPLESAMSGYEGDVRLIFKHYPLPGHKRAAPAAYTAWAAHQQDQFWVFHDRLFAAKSAIDKVPDWIKELGLDASKFGEDMESAAAKQAVDQDTLSGSKVGVTGTPAFVVNGHMYRGKRDEVGWKQIIEAELEYAKDVADDQDLERGELYDFLMQDALDRQVGAPATGRTKRERRPGEPDDSAVYAVPVEGAPSTGPDDALVTVVEFADYHCPYCARVKTAVDQLLETYPDQVRLVYRQRPLAMHPQARDASKAALAAAEQGKFWEMHDLLFLRQSKTLDEFKTLAEELGLDVAKFEADYQSQAIEDAVAADVTVAQRFGISGTPAFFINGRYLSGAQDFSVFEQIFQERLVEAKTLLEGGTPASGVYAKVIADGKSSVKE
ncbi:thioredoxin domain-containing protein [Pseudenhygromyxa sp. WMMC2535]|uniref:DsbA family protein n=1 Tax=Pseudenhygromyxa sp. WMMC2535 TaxID=2712867 RepID=UPI0015523C76|nr:thioredoxin domain-containing protein [Pseudenhygromyxa sp. WMMC2535]NVB36566.1 thioredoxin domain-containing protein [Pseudenhygromyxa sp. WMMC2535]